MAHRHIERDQRHFHLPTVSVFALIFTAIFLMHGALLRLPYFWDEAGYFVPAAWDILHGGGLIPHTTLSNAHPPVVMLWLAAWWKLSAFSPVVTRTAMLLVAAFGLLGLYKLARLVSNSAVAAGTVVLTALYPVFFAQSSLAQLDVPAMALTLWATYFYLAGRRSVCIAVAALACVTKETAVVVPLTFFAWELLCYVAQRRIASSNAGGSSAERWLLEPVAPWKSFCHLLALLPLTAWYTYHYLHTGHIFGNPEYLQYNMGATLTPLRILIAAGMRLWHTFGYMNLFVLTAISLLAMGLPPVEDDAIERPRIALRVQAVFGVLILAHVAEFSLLGGALLARYMLPVIPLVILLCVSTLWRRLAHWQWWTAAVGVAFVVALLATPPWRIAPEDNLTYSDFVRLHKQAATYVEQHYANDKILTAWPASDELHRPFLGYVKQPLTVVRVENFTLDQMMTAAQQRDGYDVVVAFSTKYDPPSGWVNRLGWWNRMQEKYFDYHSDLRPQLIATMLQGHIVWQRAKGGEWIAIIELDKIRNASLQVHGRTWLSP